MDTKIKLLCVAVIVLSIGNIIHAGMLEMEFIRIQEKCRELSRELTELKCSEKREIEKITNELRQLWRQLGQRSK